MMLFGPDGQPASLSPSGIARPIKRNEDRVIVEPSLHRSFGRMSFIAPSTRDGQPSVTVHFQRLKDAGEWTASPEQGLSSPRTGPRFELTSPSTTSPAIIHAMEVLLRTQAIEIPLELLVATAAHPIASPTPLGEAARTLTEKKRNVEDERDALAVGSEEVREDLATINEQLSTLQEYDLFGTLAERFAATLIIGHHISSALRLVNGDAIELKRLLVTKETSDELVAQLQESAHTTPECGVSPIKGGGTQILSLIAQASRREERR